MKKFFQAHYALRHFGAILIFGVLMGMVSPGYDLNNSEQQSQLLSKAIKLINQDLDAWRTSSSEVRNLACLQMLKNLEAAGDKDYSGENGKARLILEAYELRSCIDEAAKANVNIKVSDTAVSCVILMQE